ncbi:sensor histidine kinase [Telluribacter sp. SYSU D00476]|uniref:sensor histidine kinase n=1 Tax=Telluribacter sp. SYSU D00476 TaxID=2811430 RepID=UPI001FF44004|nr:histidine kinase [Telluribacter sp. SYSU D00476]
MQDRIRTRQIQLLILTGAAVVYVLRRLLQEANTFNGMIRRAQSVGVTNSRILDDLAEYDHVLNTNVPVIAGAALVLLALYMYYRFALPAWKLHTAGSRWGYGLVVLLLLLAAVFVYHYFKLYVRYRFDSQEQILGFRVYSLYRKRTVLADALGVAIILYSFDRLTQLYFYLIKLLQKDNERQARVISYLIVGSVGVGLLSLALLVPVPRVLWSRPLNDLLLFLALILLIYHLQNFCLAYILPLLRRPQSSLLFNHIVTFLLIGLLGAIVVLGAYGYPAFTFYSLNLTLLFLSISSFVIAYLRQSNTSEKIGLQTEVTSKSAELDSLRAQINPHFLFNALNSLYATALKENSDKTADGIQRLGDMMRFLLEENNREQIPLAKEVEYLENYIDIQRLRIDESQGVDIKVNIHAPDRELYLAPMLLVPFVENAFKHGVSLQHPSWIYITLTTTSTQLFFKVHNSLHVRPVLEAEEVRSGVGLDNVRKRLGLLYPDRHELTIQQSEHDYFVALALVL